MAPGEGKEEKSLIAAAQVGHQILLSLPSGLREKWEANGRKSTPLSDLLTKFDENCLESALPDLVGWNKAVRNGANHLRHPETDG